VEKMTAAVSWVCYHSLESGNPRWLAISPNSVAEGIYTLPTATLSTKAKARINNEIISGRVEVI